VLALADKYQEKTIVYSQSLKTLDLVEKLLQSEDWKQQISSLDYHRMGGWKKNEHYLRIDGSVESGNRGASVKSFNEESNFRAILISSLAGGIGINLVSHVATKGKKELARNIISLINCFQTAATRVVLLDNHFNPSVSSQCISRAWRRGQDKPVYAYRFAIEGTLETKIYKRSENKTVVSFGVVDGKDARRNFTQDECDHINKMECWVTCDDCSEKHLLEKSTYMMYHCCIVSPKAHRLLLTPNLFSFGCRLQPS
jgi:DNA repair and recombination protein RAD54B